MGLRFMDNDKNDAYYLERIKTDLEFVICHTEGKTREEIENNDLLIDSIMFRIMPMAMWTCLLSMTLLHMGFPRCIPG